MNDYRTEHEHNKADALAEMYEHAECITKNVEHMVLTSDLSLLMEDLDAVSKAVEQLKQLAEYDFVNEDDATFEYNFKYEVTDLLNDSLGYVWEEN